MTKTIKKITLLAAMAGALALPSKGLADIYPDATGEVISGGILDITSVEVTNTAYDLIFRIGLNSDPIATDWGKYMVGFDTTPGGDTAGNGWGRPISMASGMDYWIGSWVDGGNGAELRSYTGTWNLDSATWGANSAGLNISKSTTNVTVRLSMASMGLSVGSTFDFDVYSSGGGSGDSAIDALSTSSQSVNDWGVPFQTTSNKTYTIAAVPTPTNRVFFSVDMELPVYLYNQNPSDPAGFNPAADSVYVSGTFNGWTPTAAYQLFRVGASTVFTNTVDVLANPGETVSYKFYGNPYPVPNYETPQIACGGNRTLTITSANMTTPTVFWSDSKSTDPTNTISFQVDMLFPDAVPPGTNVYIAGDFNGWTPVALTNIPSTTIWAGFSVVAPYFPTNGCRPFTFKFINGTTYESIANRVYNAPSGNPTFSANFNNLVPCSVIGQPAMVTFSVDMAGSTGTGGTPVYDGTQNVYLNGEFAGWWTWGDTTNSAATNLLMSKSGDIYSITVPLPSATKTRLVYKYSMDGADNEGGFGQDHVRYVRTAPGQTNFSLPQDKFTGTNAVNIANLVEPKFGNLKAVAGAPGQVAVTWSGLKCVQLQTSTDLTGGWTSLPDTDGTSSTNWPNAVGQRYFRLIDNNP